MPSWTLLDQDGHFSETKIKTSVFWIEIKILRAGQNKCF